MTKTKAATVGMPFSKTPGSLAALLALAATSAALAQAPPLAPPMAPPFDPPPTQAAPPAPAIKDLGGGRYQIGAITVDRNARQFTVPGRVLHLDEAPLEYIAVSRAGMKAYESLLEVDSRGTEFNLACILLGLEPPQRGPSAQFDRKPPQGPAVRLAVRWQAGGATVTKSVQEVLNLAARPRGAASPPPTAAVAPPPEEWAYAGSFVSDGDGRFVADATGTLVGFVHDPASIIEHRTGLGIGAYGSVQGNPDVLPPIGTPVELIVTVPQAAR